MPFHSPSATIRSRVVPGTSWTTARRSPARRLKRVDLPTFGRPTRATIGRVIHRLAACEGTLYAPHPPTPSPRTASALVNGPGGGGGEGLGGGGRRWGGRGGANPPPPPKNTPPPPGKDPAMEGRGRRGGRGQG